MNIADLRDEAMDWAYRADEWANLPSNRKYRTIVKEMTREMRLAVEHIKHVIELYNAAPPDVDLYDYENQPDN